MFTCPSGHIYISRDVVFDKSFFPFQFPLSSLSPPTLMPSSLISIFTSLLPSIVSVPSSHVGPTIDSSSPPPPPHHILLLHHLHQHPPMSPSHHPHPQALPVSLLPGPTIWSIEHKITPEHQKVWLATLYPMPTCLMADLATTPIEPTYFTQTSKDPKLRQAEEG